MRMLMKITIPTETGNKALREGILQKVMQETINQMRPEATYFYTENGKRCAHIFFDMKDSSQIAQYAEPIYMALNAEVAYYPVMNQEELARGLEAWGKKSH